MIVDYHVFAEVFCIVMQEVISLYVLCRFRRMHENMQHSERGTYLQDRFTLDVYIHSSGWQWTHLSARETRQMLNWECFLAHHVVVS